ncbi:MAG TPA: glycosyltransferase family 39 protein [Candidatus Paceibacterota bacterium]|nr:glycosyltransferase family 39 protein [Candidatus Paceibacterota bacterium]
MTERLLERFPFLNRDWIILSGMMALILLLSGLFFANQSLRLDEAQSLWQTSRTPLGILRIIAEDVHVPFYHLILHFWQQFLGSSVIIARFLSLTFFMLSVPAMYYLCRLAYSRSFALFTTLLIAVSPFLNWYGNEIRMYSLLTFVTILNQYFFLRIYKQAGSGNWIFYGLTAVFGIFTHYFFGLMLATQAIFFFLYSDRFPRKSLSRFASVAIAIAITFVPWIFYVQSMGAAGNTKPSIPEPTSINVFNTFSHFLFGFQNDTINTILVSMWPLTVILGFLAVGKGKKLTAETMYFILSVIVPIAAVFILSITYRPLYLSRYLILTLPSLYIFISWIFSTYSPSVSKVAKSALLLVMFTTLTVQAVSATNPVREDYKDVAARLNAETKPQDIVIVTSPFTIYPLEYYYRGHSKIATLPLWDRYQVGPIPAFDESQLPNQVDQLKSHHKRAFVVMSYDQGYHDKIKHYLDNNFKKLDQERFSPGLDLYVYELY